MKIAQHIKHSLDACDSRDLEKAMLFACLAVDGTASKAYPNIPKVGARFRKFITDHIDIIEVIYGGINLVETEFPFENSIGQVGLKFEDIVYEKYRCNLAHGSELPDGYGIDLKIEEQVHTFRLNLKARSMTMPESVIYALGLPCVLAPVNADQRIGDNRYYYRDSVNAFVVDRWWGKLNCARQIIDFESAVRVRMLFQYAKQP